MKHYIQFTLTFCFRKKVINQLIGLALGSFLLLSGLLGCNSAEKTWTYTDEEYGFTFEYPMFWQPVILGQNYLRLQRVESGSVEADIRIEVARLSNSQNPVELLEDLLQNSLSGEVTVVQEPMAIHHNGYEGAISKVTLDLTLEFPIGAEGLQMPIRDSLDIRAIKHGDLMVIIYVYASPEEYHGEEAAIVDSFKFIQP